MSETTPNSDGPTEHRSEVASIDDSKLKHVGAEEKNPLPTAAMLGEELMPDRSEVASFDPSKLK
ncbi:hypothetical protein ACFXOK_21710, partial [Streptomyces sp. NPDC059173]